MKNISSHPFVTLLSLSIIVSFAVGHPSATYAAAAPAVCGIAAPQLITNGGFEAPVVSTPEQWDVYPSGTPGLGWTADWLPTDPTTFNAETQPATANLELQQSGHHGFLADEGQQWAELDTDWAGPSAGIGAPASVDIYQDVTTVPGDIYLLSFSFSPQPEFPTAADNTLSVDWGVSHVDTISRANISGTQNEWLPYTYSLVATTTTTRLMFTDLGTPNSFGTYLDAVSLCDTLATGTPGGPVPAATTTLTVIKNVINDNGGTSTASDFTMIVTGTNVSTSTFSGSATGTVVTLDAGAYSVIEATSSLSYTMSLSADCSGTLLAGDNKVCTITNDDIDPSTGSTPISASGGGGGFGGGSGGDTGGQLTGVSTGGSTIIDGGNGGTSGSSNRPVGQVLGAFDAPGMPTTGGGGNIYVTFGILLAAIFTSLEIILVARKAITR